MFILSDIFTREREKNISKCEWKQVSFVPRRCEVPGLNINFSCLSHKDTIAVITMMSQIIQIHQSPKHHNIIILRSMCYLKFFNYYV